MSMSNRSKSKGGRPSKFPPEFRRDAVAMVLDESRPIAEVARATGVNAGTLGNWVGQERVERGERDGLTTEERSDLVELRAENAQLRMERDLLKRSLAFWIRETSTP
jgi:transposase